MASRAPLQRLLGGRRLAALSAATPSFQSYAGAQSVDATGISVQDNNSTIVAFGTSQGADPVDYASPTNNYNPHNDPVVVYVDRPGFTTAGASTTRTDAVTLMSRKRQQHPNEASWEAVNTTPTPDEVTAMLSHRIHSVDTVRGSDGSEDGITNNSTATYYAPAAVWGHSGYLRTNDGNLTARLYVTSRYARLGAPVAAVKFTIDDGVHAAKEVTVSGLSLTDVTHSNGLHAPYFQPSFTDLDDLNDGLYPIHYTIYPWVGPAYSSSSDGNGQRQLCNFPATVLIDAGGTYGQAHAMVAPSSTGASATVYATESAMTAAYSGDANTAYATINAAITAIATFNDANYTRPNWHDHANTAYVSTTDCGGGTVHLQEATYTKANWPRNQTQDFPLTIQPAAGAAAANVILQGTSSLLNRVPMKLCMKGFTFRQVASNTFNFFGGGTLSNATEDRCLVLEDMIFDINGQSLTGNIFGQWHRIFMVNCTGDDVGVFVNSGTNIKTGIAIGSTSVGQQVISMVGNKVIRDNGGSGATNCYDPIGPNSSSFGWFSAGPRCVGHSHLGVANASGARCISIAPTADDEFNDFHLVMSVFETDNDPATAPAIYFAADSIDFDCTGGLIQGCTPVGDRINAFYNDDASAVFNKDVAMQGTVCVSLNMKDDTEGNNSSAGAFDGVAGTQYKVDWRDNCWLGLNANSNRGPGPGDNWMGEVRALGEFDSEINSNTDIDPDWTDDNTAAGGTGANGDYRPGASTEISTLTAGLAYYPIDFMGQSLADDGTALAGALQPA